MTTYDSNTEAFTVLADAPVPLATGIELEIYDRNDYTQLINVVPLRIAPTWLDELGPCGGSFTIMYDDPQLKATPQMLNYRNIVRVKLNGSYVGAWVITKKSPVLVDQGEYASRAIAVSGIGLRQWLTQAVVFPEGTLQADSATNRVFNFATVEKGAWYDRITWASTVPLCKQSSLDATPGDASYNPWKYSPANWPDAPDAYWVWDRDSRTGPAYAPEGDCYFRCEFTTTDDNIKYSLFCTADNYFVAYVDGQQVLDGQDAGAYHQTYNADVTLDAGSHVLGVHCRNAAQGPAALLAVLFQYGSATAGPGDLGVAFTAADIVTQTGWSRDQPGAVAAINTMITDTNSAAADASVEGAGTGVTGPISDAQTYASSALTHATGGDLRAARANVVEAQLKLADALTAAQAAHNTATAAALQTAIGDSATATNKCDTGSWVVTAYPAKPPGWTAGDLIYQLVSEATARGVANYDRLTLNFTRTTDSEGNAWTTDLDWAFNLGDQYDTVVTKIEELLAEFWVDATTLELCATAVRGSDRSVQTNVQTVQFMPGYNITKSAQDGEDRTKNFLLTLNADRNNAWAQYFNSDSIANYGRIEGFLSVSGGASGDFAGTVADKTLSDYAKALQTTTLEIIARPGAIPWVDFVVGDYVLAPDDNDSAGTLIKRRVVAIGLGEDYDTRQPTYTVELDTMSQRQDQKLQKWLARLQASSGTLGGSVANAAAAGGSGGGSGTSSNASTSVGAPGPQGPPGVDGNTILSGSNPPGASDGSDGDYWWDYLNRTLYGPKLGTWPAGVALTGTIIYTGSGAPSSGTGANGDYYWDSTNRAFYGPKAAGSWPAPVSLIGPQGIQGPRGNSVLSGTVNPTASDGINGDYWINNTSEVLFGPKAGGAWPSTGTSLIGPQGTQGIQGIQGITGAAGAPGRGNGNMNWRGVWDPTAAYALYDVVRYNGLVQVCTTPLTGAPVLVSSYQNHGNSAALLLGFTNLGDLTGTPQAGDTAIVVWSGYDNVPVNPQAGGWTVLGSGQNGADVHSGALARVLTAADITAGHLTIDASGAGSNGLAVVMYVVRGGNVTASYLQAGLSTPQVGAVQNAWNLQWLADAASVSAMTAPAQLSHTLGTSVTTGILAGVESQVASGSSTSRTFGDTAISAPLAGTVVIAATSATFPDTAFTSAFTPSRATSSVTTTTLAVSGRVQTTIPLSTGYKLYQLQVSKLARVRLYDTAAHQAADAARAFGTDPTGNHGVMLDYQVGATPLTRSLSPMVEGASLETSPTSAIPLTVDNADTTSGAVTVTLTWIRTE